MVTAVGREPIGQRWCGIGAERLYGGTTTVGRTPPTRELLVPSPIATLGVLAQSATETGLTTAETKRPLSDWVRSTFGDGRTADVIEFLIEPALQILLVVVIALVVKWLANRLIDRVVRP